MFSDIPHPDTLRASGGTQEDLLNDYSDLYSEIDDLREQWDYLVELMDEAYERFDAQRELVDQFPGKLQSIVSNMTELLDEFARNVTTLFEEHVDSFLAVVSIQLLPTLRQF